MEVFLEMITQPFLGSDGIVPDSSTGRPFDVPVVVPADAVVDRDEHLVAGTLLPTLGMDGFRLHSTEEPLRGGVVRGTALRAHRPRQAVAVHERQPSGPPAVASAALTSILSASPALGVFRQINLRVARW